MICDPKVMQCVANAYAYLAELKVQHHAIGRADERLCEPAMVSRKLCL